MSQAYIVHWYVQRLSGCHRFRLSRFRRFCARSLDEFFSGLMETAEVPSTIAMIMLHITRPIVRDPGDSVFGRMIFFMAIVAE
jgi:hypothetical protein